VGGPGLTMAEINRVMHRVNRQCDGVHLVLGALVDPGMGDALGITLVASRSTRADADVPAADAAAKPAAHDGSEFLHPGQTQRPASRVVAPPPAPTPENLDRLKAAPSGAKSRRKHHTAEQVEMPLEIVSKGRFEKSEPTLRNGEDLDYPTFVRKGVALN